MKKLLILLAVSALFSTAAYADSVEISLNEPTEITGLTERYYDLRVNCKNNSVDENTYIYGISDNHTISSTVIPKSDTDIIVTVKGIGVTDGKCEIGVVSDNSTVTVSNAELVPSEPNNFIVGGDMTEVNYIESLDGEYKDADGKKVDPFEYLAANGLNMARIRLSNKTGKGTGDGSYYLPEGFQDEKDCLDLARRAKAAGMGIQFTFNYSDYWSNGSRQIIPSEWVKQIKSEFGYDIKDAAFLNSMTAKQRTEIKNALAKIVYDYTFDIMTKLKNQGTVPEYVSLGNEIRGGMLFPFGNTYAANMNNGRFELVFGDDKNDSEDIKCPADWDGLVQFINAGYDAVKAVSPESQVVIHLDDGSKVNKFDYFLNDLNKRGAKYDVIGASYYPAWTGNSVEACVDFCNTITKQYDKDILIMETGFNWNATKKNGYGGQLIEADVYKEKYPPTQDGHAGFLAELINGLKGVDGGRCVGILYWDPCMIHVEDIKNPNESLSGWAIRESDDKADSNVVENTTLFDFDGKAIKSVGIINRSRSNTGRLIGEINTDGADTVTATVKNTTQKEKKPNLYIAEYDGEGILRNIKVFSDKVSPDSSVMLNADKPDGDYRAFLWNGENFEPIVK